MRGESKLRYGPQNAVRDWLMNSWYRFEHWMRLLLAWKEYVLVLRCVTSGLRRFGDGM
jgi:hypothetical protein